MSLVCAVQKDSSSAYHQLVPARFFSNCASLTNLLGIIGQILLAGSAWKACYQLNLTKVTIWRSPFNHHSTCRILIWSSLGAGREISSRLALFWSTAAVTKPGDRWSKSPSWNKPGHAHMFQVKVGNFNVQFSCIFYWTSNCSTM